ncbi:MAG: tetratricopeptide repeat protein [Phenylobacterium sp.]|nr:tetratricopeptide repeat protein [Phenylobacterium sp.]
MIILVASLCALSVWPHAATAASDFPNPGWERVDAALERKDDAEARRIAEELAAKGDPEAINGLAVLVAQGIGGPADPRRSNALLEQAVAAGSVGAKLNVARSLASGPDKSQWPRALSLLQDVIKEPKLAQVAYYPLGRIMTLGGHGRVSERQGVKYLNEAIKFEPRNADAQFLVARAFQNGWGGTEKDSRKAFTHFLAAAKLGDERALRYVGMARLNGDGVARDPPAALADFKAAAELGNVSAMIDVAVMLAIGEGVSADPALAREWYLKAAGQGSAHALRGLGAMLFVGDGGDVDPLTGRAYLELAIDAGDKLAPQAAEQLFDELSPSERAAVDQLKADWLKAHPVPKAD